MSGSPSEVAERPRNWVRNSWSTLTPCRYSRDAASGMPSVAATSRADPVGAASLPSRTSAGRPPGRSPARAARIPVATSATAAV